MQFPAEILGLLHGDLESQGVAPSSDYRFSDISLKGAYSGSLAASFLKKLEPIGENVKANDAALDLFLDCNAKLPSLDYEYPADNEADSLFWDYFRSNLNKTLGDTVGSEVFKSVTPSSLDVETDADHFQSIDLDFIRRHMNIGPGANRLANADNIVTKLFEGTISHYGSDYLISLYRAALVETGSWSDAERLRFQKFGFTRVRGAKLFFAKKNADISRVCCTQALLEMLFQKVCCAFAEKRLGACFGIYLDKQPLLNQQMAKRGSIDGTIGTIDLKSASDMQGLHMINKALDHCSFKTMINLCREKFVVLPSNRRVELNMISTMGNAFTFPLQTIVFACAVRSVYAMMDIPSFDSNGPTSGVFGDDICVRREAYHFLIRSLEKLGFTVNKEKSFNSGPFRESCGTDWHSGHNIRGVYIKSLNSPQQICSAVNRLNRWSARSGIDLPLVTSALLACVPKAPLVPITEDDLAGIKVPFYRTIPQLDNDYNYRYRKYKQKSKRVVVREPDDAVNPYGVCVGYLSGHIRRRDTEWGKFWSDIDQDVLVPIRDKSSVPPRFKISGAVISFWDYCPPSVGMVADEYKNWSDLVLGQQ